MQTHATSMFTVSGFQVKFCKEVGMSKIFIKKGAKIIIKATRNTDNKIDDINDIIGKVEMN